MTALDAVPRPITPGAEMAALLRFHCDITWTGSISAGGMGPGTPAMTAEGSGTHTTIQDGRWVVGDYRQEQYLLDGTHVLTWQLHWGRRLRRARRGAARPDRHRPARVRIDGRPTGADPADLGCKRPGHDRLAQ